MKKQLFNLFATALLVTGSSLAFSQNAFDALVKSADSTLKQFATSGSCQGNSCNSSVKKFGESSKTTAQSGSCSKTTTQSGGCSSTTTQTTDCSDGSCDNASSDNTTATTTSGVSVAKALEDVNFVSGKPNLEADYYIYLYSASWCPPCRKLMPSIVKEYADIKKSEKVELILIGADKNEDGVKSYVDKYDAKFPATWMGSKGVAKIPGNKPPRGIPGAVIVDKEGNIITSGYGNIVLEWKKHTIDKK